MQSCKMYAWGLITGCVTSKSFVNLALFAGFSATFAAQNVSRALVLSNAGMNQP
ncbi:MAG: hypothetical protein WCR52_12370 [Bacteroidota bacterium]